MASVSVSVADDACRDTNAAVSEVSEHAALVSRSADPDHAEMSNALTKRFKKERAAIARLVRFLRLRRSVLETHARAAERVREDACADALVALDSIGIGSSTCGARACSDDAGTDEADARAFQVKFFDDVRTAEAKVVCAVDACAVELDARLARVDTALERLQAAQEGELDIQLQLFRHCARSGGRGSSRKLRRGLLAVAGLTRQEARIPTPSFSMPRGARFLKAAAAVSADLGNADRLDAKVAYALEHEDVELMRIVLSDSATPIRQATVCAALASHKLSNTDVLDTLLADARLSESNRLFFEELLVFCAADAQNALAVRALLRDGRADTQSCIEHAMTCLLRAALSASTDVTRNTSAYVTTLQELLASQKLNSRTWRKRVVEALGLAGLRVVLEDSHRATRPYADYLFLDCVSACALHVKRQREALRDIREMLVVLVEHPAFRGEGVDQESAHCMKFMVRMAVWLVAHDPRHSGPLLRAVFMHPCAYNDVGYKIRAVVDVLVHHDENVCAMSVSDIRALMRVIQDFVDAEPALTPRDISYVLFIQESTTNSRLHCEVAQFLQERARAA